ncbi:efflux RND transporter periplasmic adaptor subunit [Pseudohalioglobus lutimaris]|uniref:Efflux RND transporter periplasmic adaptor subunit n=1 Tax=Pseudohalioglobus lutimaris TaxID=1737061 RepID=A0A2N5X1V9_9GAMM|nr:efflux RND transporter periplasmic adaptor subunit [Pseudohalioglobus lutimaris]PLW68475.1 efflux RND transporter periplasmic adaptor subunit [Pseudohalioglobus lutimaris]
MLFKTGLFIFPLLLIACSEEAVLPPMIEVVVDQVVLEPYQPKSEYVGRLQARDDVAIQARVSGYVVSRDFREGQLVEEGDILYRLDASEFDAALAKAKADLAAAQANQANAVRNYSRGRELLPRGAISESEMDDLTAKKLDADARIESAWAQMKSAEVNLSYTTIIAPITGRIGRSIASVGDLVGPNTGNLTTLVSIDPIEALFNVSEAAYVAAMKSRMTEEPDISALRDVEVTLELTTGMVYPEVGRIDYFSNRVDQETGTLEARAAIPNPHSILVPGQYVKVILQDTNLLEGLFVPQAAVQADQQGSFVLVVDSNSTVQRHNVELDQRIDFMVRVVKGVEEGEQVIVRGLQQVRPGMVVKVRELPAPAQGQE